jgi:hypothetical protein
VERDPNDCIACRFKDGGDKNEEKDPHDAMLSERNRAAPFLATQSL